MTLIAPIFIGGSGRSGTSLIRVILDSHPHIACGPEFKFLPSILENWTLGIQVSGVLKNYELSLDDWSASYRNFIASLLQPYLQKSGKQRLAEKSPNNVFYFYQLHKIFPDARFIHIIRDGRDVVCSLRKMNWTNPATGATNVYGEPKTGAEYWVKAVSAGLKARELIPGNRIYTLRYEDLVQNPEPQLRALFEFLGEPWDEEVMSFHKKQHHFDTAHQREQLTQNFYQTARGRWQRELNEQELAQVTAIAGELLDELGYKTTGS